MPQREGGQGHVTLLNFKTPGLYNFGTGEAKHFKCDTQINHYLHVVYKRKNDKVPQGAWSGSRDSRFNFGLTFKRVKICTSDVIHILTLVSKVLSKCNG